MAITAKVLRAPRLLPDLPQSWTSFTSPRRIRSDGRRILEIRCTGAGVNPSPADDSNAAPKKSSWLSRVKEFFFDTKTKERLAALGMGAFASYGTISNVSYGICMTIAWYTFVQQTGMSPLAPGQWKPFLAVYAGLWVMQNFLRPFRLALALALAPAFNSFIDMVSNRTGLNKKWSFGLLLLMIASGTITFLVLAIATFGGKVLP